MRRLMIAVLAGGMVAVLAGTVSLAASAPQARVGDLVKLIATSKKMKVEEVEKFLAASGLRLESRAALTERIAADVFGALGVRSTAAGDQVIGTDQLGRLGSLATFASFEAAASDDNEVKNRGKKTRKGGNQPNSNAGPNAFGSIRDDPRD